MSVAIQWFENAAFDAPELKSPQPCIHGAGCVYTKKTADGKVVPAVCGFVHPGEEGRGRRLFPARTIIFEHPDGDDVVEQPACVRLIGGALYYERMRMRMPWQAFCAVRGISFTANVPGVYREPVRRVPIGSPRVVPTKNEQRQHEIVGKLVSLSAELSSLMGPAPLSAIATADQNWPVLGGRGGGGAMQRETAAEEAARGAGGHDYEDDVYSDYDECERGRMSDYDECQRVTMSPERRKFLVKESERLAAFYRASQSLAETSADLK